MKLLPLATQALTSQSFPPVTSNPFPFQWPLAPIADTGVRLPLLAVQATQAFQDVTNPTPFPWPTSPMADTSPEADLSMRLPSLTIAAHTPLPHSSLLYSK